MRKILVFLPVLLFCPSLLFGMDWKMLHEKADKLTLQEAMESVVASKDSLDEQYILGLVYLNIHQDREA